MFSEKPQKCTNVMFTRFLFFEVLIELLPVWGHALAVAAPRRKELDEG